MPHFPLPPRPFSGCPAVTNHFQARVASKTSSRLMPPAGELQRTADPAPTTKRPAGDQPMTVEERLTRLEKTLRRWRYLSLILVLAVAGLAGGLAFDFLGVRGTIRAKRV